MSATSTWRSTLTRATQRSLTTKNSPSPSASLRKRGTIKTRSNSLQTMASASFHSTSCSLMTSMWLLKRKNKGGQLMITTTWKNPLTLKIMMGLQSSLFSRPTGKKKRMRFLIRTSWLLIRIQGSSSGEVQLRLKISLLCRTTLWSWQRLKLGSLKIRDRLQANTSVGIRRKMWVRSVRTIQMVRELRA
jgi:hypothetical protein